MIKSLAYKLTAASLQFIVAGNVPKPMVGQVGDLNVILQLLMVPISPETKSKTCSVHLPFGLKLSINFGRGVCGTKVPVKGAVPEVMLGYAPVRKTVLV